MGVERATGFGPADGVNGGTDRRSRPSGPVAPGGGLSTQVSFRTALRLFWN